MKRMLLCLLLFTSSYCSFSQLQREIPAIPVRDSFDLKGSVTGLTEHRFTFPGGIPTFIYKKEISFNSLGMVDTIVTTTGAEEVRTIRIYRYDDDNRIGQIVMFDRSGMEDSAVFEYNTKEQLRKIAWYNGKHQLKKAAKFRYSGNRLLYIRNEDGNNALNGMIRFRYSGPNEYKRMVFDDHLKLSFSHVFVEERDTLNYRNVFCYHYVSEDSFSSMETTRYDENGKLTELVRTGPDRKVVDYLTNIYDEAGYLKEQTVFAGAKVQATYTHELDGAGNWLKRKRSVNGEIREIMTRSLTYKSDEPS